MVPTNLEIDKNRYNEYIIVESADGVRSIEQIGSLKVDLSDYADSLISKEDRKKLDAIHLNENELQISTSQISDLSKWIVDSSEKVKGLSENNLNNELYNKLNQSLQITSINTDALSLLNGHLDLVNKGGSNQELSNKVNSIETNIETILNSLSKTTDRIDILEDQLTWHNL